MIADMRAEREGQHVARPDRVMRLLGRIAVDASSALARPASPPASACARSGRAKAICPDAASVPRSRSSPFECESGQSREGRAGARLGFAAGLRWRGLAICAGALFRLLRMPRVIAERAHHRLELGELDAAGGGGFRIGADRTRLGAPAQQCATRSSAPNSKTLPPIRRLPAASRAASSWSAASAAAMHGEQQAQELRAGACRRARRSRPSRGRSECRAW